MNFIKFKEEVLISLFYSLLLVSLYGVVAFFFYRYYEYESKVEVESRVENYFLKVSLALKEGSPYPEPPYGYALIRTDRFSKEIGEFREGMRVLYREGYTEGLGYYRVGVGIPREVLEGRLKFLLNRLIFLGILFAIGSFLLGFTFSRAIFKRIRERERELEKSIYYLSHELKTPLSTLKLLYESVKGKLEEEDREDMGVVLRVLEKKVQLGLRALGDVKVIHQRVSLREIVEQTLFELRRLYSHKDLKLKTNLEDLKVYSSQEDLYVILYNLISNAFKYSPPKGEVRIVLEGRSLLIENETYQGKRPEGSGIGLKLVRRLAQRLGLRVKVREGRDRFLVKVLF